MMALLRRRRINRISNSDRAALERELDEAHRNLIRSIWSYRCCLCGNPDAEVAHIIPKSVNPHRRWAIQHVLFCRQHHDAFDGRLGNSAQREVFNAFSDEFPVLWRWRSEHIHKREEPWSMTGLREHLEFMTNMHSSVEACLYVSKLARSV
jgi:hypothetical protein